MGEGMVYWAELQSELSGVGLSVAVEMPRQDYPFFGHIDERPFTMTVAAKGGDGFRELMVVSFYGQDEKKVIPLLSKFMAYEPFCKYLHKKDHLASATYEWDKKDPVARFKELEADSDIYDLQKLEKGFVKPEVRGAEEFYQQFTPEIVKAWEEGIQKNPAAEYNCNLIEDILPFVKEVMPRIGKTQSLFGLSIISLAGKTGNDRKIVKYGLEPLLAAGILLEKECEEIINWYLATEPTWDSGGAGKFIKDFVVKGKKYRLITDSYRNSRDLNLQVISK